MRNTLLILIIVSIFSSCEYNYDIDKHFDREFVSKVVLNSLITPDSLINGDLFWSKSINDTSAFKKVKYFYIKLYEDGNLILDGKGSDGDIKTEIRPKAGASYKIELTIPDYGKIEASTTIPLTGSTFISSYDGEKESASSPYYAYKFYTISSITPMQQSRALWIKAETEYTDKISEKVIYFYLENAFCDQINASRGDDIDVSLRGSVIFHEHFIRIPYKNISYTLPLKFSIQALFDRYTQKYLGEDDLGYPIYERVDIPVTNVNLLVITPSDDYDKYHKSSYWQIHSSYVSDIPIFIEPTSVYSNINNGIGIFAGYLVEKQEYKVEDK